MDEIGDVDEFDTRRDKNDSPLVMSEINGESEPNSADRNMSEKEMDDVVKELAKMQRYKLNSDGLYFLEDKCKDQM